MRRSPSVPNPDDRTRAGKPELQRAPPADYRPRLAKRSTVHGPRSFCVSLRGFAASREPNRLPPHPPRVRDLRTFKTQRTELGLESPSYRKDHPRTPVRGSPNGPRSTLPGPFAFPFAASRLRVNQNACNRPRPGAAISQRSKPRGQNSGWKARATETHTRGLPSAARQTENRTTQTALSPLAYRLLPCQ